MGIRGTALNWFYTYLSGRTQSITIEDVASDVVPLATGVPQGSVLGTILFLIYIQPLSEIISTHNISRHGYADDTQLYTRFSLKDDSGLQTAISKLEQFIHNVRKWLIENKLKINDGKTEMLIVTSSRNKEQILHRTPQIKVGNEIIKSSQAV